MWAIQIPLVIVFSVAGAMKRVTSNERVEHNHQSSEAQIRLLGLAELLGAIGAPTEAGIAPFLSRVGAACLATLMSGAVATHPLQRKSAVTPTVVARRLIAVATAR